MSLVVLGAAKGAPGVTTAAVALAAVWPRPAVVAECDPSGGDLALRLTSDCGRPLARDHGILSLAAAARSNALGASVRDHVQTAAGGLEVLTGAATPGQAAALDPLWPALAARLAATQDCDVFADCGRLTPPTVALHLAQGARLFLLITRSTASGLAHLRPLLSDLAERDLSALVVVLPVSERRGPTLAEVDEVVQRASGRLRTATVGPLAYDPVGAAGLAGVWTRHLDRTPLVESARLAAHELDSLLASPVAAAG
jgi:hypothetical protein